MTVRDKPFWVPVPEPLKLIGALDAVLALFGVRALKVMGVVGTAAVVGNCTIMVFTCGTFGARFVKLQLI